MLHEIPPTAGLPLKGQDFFLPGNHRDFKQKLRDFLKVEFVQLECSGTAALIIALSALSKLSSRRKVIIPAYTCPLVALAVHQAGLEIVLCDIQKDSFDLNPDQLSMLCNQDTLCVVPNHLGGLICNLDIINNIARKNGAYVIENAAQSLGATAHGQAAGTTGDISILSFTRGKGLTIWEGGLLTARDPSIIEALNRASAQLSKVNWGKEISSCLYLCGYGLFYRPTALALLYGLPLRYHLSRGNIIRALDEEFNFPVPVYQVSRWRSQLGASALERLPSFLKDNRRRALARIKQLKDIPGLHVLEESAGTTGSWPFLTLVFNQKEACEQVLTKLWCSGLGVTRVFAYDLTGYPYLKSIVSQTPVPNAANFAARMLTISNSPWLDETRFQQILKVIEDT